MKSITTLLLVALFNISYTQASSQTRLNNTHIISVGIGAITTADFRYQAIFTTNKDFETSNSGLFHFKYEYAFTDKISAGLSLGYTKIRGSWKASNSNDEIWDLSFSEPNAGNYSLSSTSIVARFNWSMLKTEKIDVYFGTGAGLRFESYSENVVDSEIFGAENIKMLAPLSFEASFGLRYFITPNFGFYSEVGLAKSFFQGGVVLGF